jgi:hypothetical protein
MDANRSELRFHLVSQLLRPGAVSSPSADVCAAARAVTPALVRSVLQPRGDLKRHGHEEGAPDEVAECGDFRLVRKSWLPKPQPVPLCGAEA